MGSYVVEDKRRSFDGSQSDRPGYAGEWSQIANTAVPGVAVETVKAVEMTQQEQGELLNRCFEMLGADRVLIVPDRAPTQAGAIVIPELAQRRPTSGLCVAAGPDCKRAKAGQRYIYHRFAGTSLSLGLWGGDVMILGDEELLLRILDPEVKFEGEVA